MAVSGKTATYELPYFLGTDKPPDMAAVTKAISERVEALLAKGGDVSIAADGTVTVKDGAVTSRKVKPTAGQVASSGNLVLSSSYQAIPGMSVVLPDPGVASLVQVNASFNLTWLSGSPLFQIRLLRDEADQGIGVAWTLNANMAIAPGLWTPSLTAGGTRTLKFEARILSGEGTGQIPSARFQYHVFAS